MIPTLLACALASSAGVAAAGESRPQEDYSLSVFAQNEVSLPATVRVTVVPGLMEGDCSMDGHTNIIDAMFIAQYTVGLRSLDPYELTCGDTNDDGAVNIIDAMHIAQYTVDPTGSGNVLFEPLWNPDPDAKMLLPG